jgi:uncharacterized membrane-anchored protein
MIFSSKSKESIMSETNLVSRTSRILSSIALLAVFTGLVSALQAQTPAPADTPKPNPIGWKKGPFTANLGGVAELKVPEGYAFADGDGARKYLELTHNPSGGSEVGILTPASDQKADNWIVLFDFDDTGYVKDDEKSSIDADKLLASMKKGNEADNEERKKRGWEAFHLTGWQTMPFYDQSTHNLTWGTLGDSEDPKEGETVNYATRILGRRGVMRTDLVTDPEQAATAIPKFKELLTGFSFTAGSRYADFVKGDKVAEYGLTALIAGGAAAVAIKTGLFAKLLALLAGLWKVIAVAFAALLSRIKQIFASIRRKISGEEKAPSVDDLR